MLTGTHTMHNNQKQSCKFSRLERKKFDSYVNPFISTNIEKLSACDLNHSINFKYHLKHEMAAILQWTISRTKLLVLYCNFIRILKIDRETRCFQCNTFHQRHVKSETIKKPRKVTKQWFQQPVYGKPNFSVTQTSNYLLNISPN